jgi:hypothetical protein
MFRLHPLRVSFQLAALLALGPGAALAEGASVPASVAPATSSQAVARESFSTFARSWLDKLQKGNGKIEQDASGVTRRQLDGDFTTELRATGQPTTPYVGLLRYTEHVYRCSGAGQDSCVVQASIPVTEIFRFENGRWVY